MSYPEHLSYLNPSTLCAWLGRFGFAPVTVRTTGFSLACLQRGVTSATPAEQCSDEQLRVRIERSRMLRAAKSTVNGALAIAGAGDTIKGYFELRG